MSEKHDEETWTGAWDSAWPVPDKTAPAPSVAETLRELAIAGRANPYRVLSDAEVEAIEAGARALENEVVLLRRLSDAVSGGNATTWDEVIHAAESRDVHESLDVHEIVNTADSVNIAREAQARAALLAEVRAKVAELNESGGRLSDCWLLFNQWLGDTLDAAPPLNEEGAADE